MSQKVGSSHSSVQFGSRAPSALYIDRSRAPSASQRESTVIPRQQNIDPSSRQSSRNVSVSHMRKSHSRDVSNPPTQKGQSLIIRHNSQISPLESHIGSKSQHSQIYDRDRKSVSGSRRSLEYDVNGQEERSPGQIESNIRQRKTTCRLVLPPKPKTGFFDDLYQTGFIHNLGKIMFGVLVILFAMSILECCIFGNSGDTIPRSPCCKRSSCGGGNLAFPVRCSECRKNSQAKPYNGCVGCSLRPTDDESWLGYCFGKPIKWLQSWDVRISI